MEYSKELQAWMSSSLDECKCPVCDNSLRLGWQKCSCGQLLNVERIEKDYVPVFLVTQEQDEVADLMQHIQQNGHTEDVQNSLV